MKKVLLFAAVAATVLSGCSKQFVDEPVNPDQTGNIGFDTYVYNSTKGMIKDAFVMGDQFKVIGGQTGPNVAFNVATPVFTGWVFDAPNFADNGATVSNYGNDVWRYENPVGWGVDNVTFFGFSPVSTATETYGITYAAAADLTTIPSINFEVKGGYDASKIITDPEAVASRVLTKQQVDLLWVCAADQSRANRTVNLMFNHALSRLSFAVRSNAPVGHRIRINSMALKNVLVDGKLTLAHDESVGATIKPGDENYLGGWAAGATKKSFAINLINNVASLITDNEVHTITDNDEALMMIPQDLAGVELEVRYAYSEDGINWENYETGVEVKVKLDELTTHWNPNKQIRYILNITPGDVIGFTADITPWGDNSDIEYRSFEVGKDVQTVTKMTLAAGDKIHTVKDELWITYAEGVSAAANLTSAGVVATAGEYTFAVKNNLTTVAREEQIIIEQANGKKTIIKVTQLAGNGTVRASTSAGEIASFVLKTGDKISTPVTKADAVWVLVNGVSISSEFIASADGEVVISVEANKGVARKAEFTVTPTTGDATTYTIDQAGIEVVKVTLAAAAAKVLDGAIGDEIALVSGGGDWFTYTETDGVAIELTSTAVTTTKEYTLDVVANDTKAVRKVVFTITNADGTKGYEVTQVSEKTETKTIIASGGEVFTGVVLAEGDFIELVAGGTAKFKINNGTADVALAGKVSAAGTYTVTASENTSTENVKTATVKVKIGSSTEIYVVTVEKADVAAATEVSLVAAGGEVLAAAAYAGGDSFEITTAGTAFFTINDGTTTSDFTTKVEAVDGTSYTINAKANSTATAQTATITVIKAGVKSLYNVTVAATVVTPPTVVAIAVDADGTFTADALNGYTISLLAGGEWLLVDDVAIADGEVTGAGVLTASANATLASRIVTFTATNGVTVKNYTVTQAGVAPTITAVEITADVDGTLSEAVTFAGETISNLVITGSWVLVDSVAITEIAVTGDLSLEVNTGTEELVATFTATSVDGLTITNYTVTQAGTI